jgi:hypothetical protein
MSTTDDPVKKLLEDAITSAAAEVVTLTIFIPGIDWFGITQSVRPRF